MKASDSAAGFGLESGCELIINNSIFTNFSNTVFTVYPKLNIITINKCKF